MLCTNVCTENWGPLETNSLPTCANLSNNVLGILVQAANKLLLGCCLFQILNGTGGSCSTVAAQQEGRKFYLRACGVSAWSSHVLLRGFPLGSLDSSHWAKEKHMMWELATGNSKLSVGVSVGARLSIGCYTYHSYRFIRVKVGQLGPRDASLKSTSSAVNTWWHRCLCEGCIHFKAQGKHKKTSSLEMKAKLNHENLQILFHRVCV